jgi:hypothetical protein
VDGDTWRRIPYTAKVPPSPDLIPSQHQPLAAPNPETAGWINEELAACSLPDQRLRQRLQQLLQQFSSGLGESIPLACQDWANTKAAYRFFSNERVTEQDILEGHWQATQQRVAATNGPVLVLHDTTEFSFNRRRIKGVGALYRYSRARRGDLTLCGMLMHSSLVVTTEGLPLGLAAVKFWTRKKFKGTNALKRSVNPTRVPMAQKKAFAGGRTWSTLPRG